MLEACTAVNNRKKMIKRQILGLLKLSLATKVDFTIVSAKALRYLR